MEDTDKYFYEMNFIKNSIINYHNDFKNMYLKLINKQTKPIFNVIKWAENNNKIYNNCIEKDLSPDEIINKSIDEIDKCIGIKELIDDYSLSINEIEDNINSLKQLAIDEIIGCGNNYNDFTTHVCLNSIKDRFKQAVVDTYEINISILKKYYQTDDVYDDLYNELFDCIVKARISVLHYSKFSASRIRACILNEELPKYFINSPQIDFLQIQPPSELYIHIMKAIDDD